MHARKIRLLAVALLVLSVAGLARASDFSDDLRARRARVMKRLGRDAMLILWSAPVQRYSNDVDYEYRQDSNLYYLTGITQDDTMLVLMPGNESRQEILFVKERDATREHWRGRSLSSEEAAARTGIETVLTTKQFDAFAAAILAGRPYEVIDDKQAKHFFDARSDGKARVNLLLDPGRGVNDLLTPPLQFAQRIRERFVGFEIADATPILTDLRLIKTPYERKMFVKSFEISNEAQMAGMRAAHPGAYEYEVKAAIEAVFRGRGAVSWAYPSIIGSGPNSTILHYPQDDRQMQSGDVLLVDAAANYAYMSGDITRTYPVNGVFTPAQRQIYQIVLQAQEEGMKVAKPGSSLAEIHQKTVDVIKAGLLKLGLITDASGDQYKMWYTHGSSHFIGIDVHDVGTRTQALAVGMMFTIEPGIYVRQSALDALPRTPENNTLIEKILPSVREYENIGTRIEDSFLIEDSGLVRLSTGVPRTIDEVEAFLRTRPGGSTGSK